MQDVNETCNTQLTQPSAKGNQCNGGKGKTSNQQRESNRVTALCLRTSLLYAQQQPTGSLGLLNLTVFFLRCWLLVAEMS
jgi:hypothetical protein